MKTKLKSGPKTRRKLDCETPFIELRNGNVAQAPQFSHRLNGFTARKSTSCLTGPNSLVKPFKFPSNPYEYKVTPLRECPTPENLKFCNTPIDVLRYWRLHIATHPYFNPDCECLAVLLLNARLRIKGHNLVSIGTLDTVLASPREVFRVAVITAAASIIVMHNHPSGDSCPTDNDIRVTRRLLKAGDFLEIKLLDHIVVGQGNTSSLRELGYFYSV